MSDLFPITSLSLEQVLLVSEGVEVDYPEKNLLAHIAIQTQIHQHDKDLVWVAIFHELGRISNPDQNYIPRSLALFEHFIDRVPEVCDYYKIRWVIEHHLDDPWYALQEAVNLKSYAHDLKRFTLSDKPDKIAREYRHRETMSPHTYEDYVRGCVREMKIWIENGLQRPNETTVLDIVNPDREFRSAQEIQADIAKSLRDV